VVALVIDGVVALVLVMVGEALVPVMVGVALVLVMVGVALEFWVTWCTVAA
jgi:hypothetical protein